MIKSDELREFRPNIRYKEGSYVTLQSLNNAIMSYAQSMGLPLASYADQVKTGNIFSKTVEDCIVFYHPEHKSDYFKFCVRVVYQGNYAFVSVMDFGESKQMKKADQANAYRESRKGQSMSFKVGSLIGQGFASIGKNKSKLEEEQRYYSCVADVFDEVVS